MTKHSGETRANLNFNHCEKSLQINKIPAQVETELQVPIVDHKSYLLEKILVRSLLDTRSKETSYPSSDNFFPFYKQQKLRIRVKVRHATHSSNQIIFNGKAFRLSPFQDVIHERKKEKEGGGEKRSLASFCDYLDRHSESETLKRMTALR